MDKKESQYIRELLEKFYNGETSIEEEQKLTEFFKTTEVLPQDLEGDRRMFMAIYNPSAMPEMPEGLEENIMRNIEREEGKRKWKIVGWVAAVAAMVTVIITLPFVFETRIDEGRVLAVDSQLKMTVDTVNEPESMSSGIVTDVVKEDTETKNQKPAIAKVGDEKRVVAVKRAEYKTGDEDIEEISEEQLEGMEKGLAALAKTGKLLAFADKSVEEADSRFSEACNRANEIINNIK